MTSPTAVIGVDTPRLDPVGRRRPQRTGAVLNEFTVEASAEGYEALVELAEGTRCERG